MDNAQPQTPVQEPQQPIVPNTPTEQLKPQITPKIPIIVMFVVTLLSLALSGYLAYQNHQLNQKIGKSEEISPSPTTDPTADWKTYTNDVYGFSFKYPKSATLESTNFDNTDFNIMLSNLTGVKYEELVVYAGSEWAYSNTKADKTENYTLAGVSAYREDNPAGQNPAETLIYVKSGKYYYTIHQTKDENDANIEKVFDQILSTFKFVE